MYNQGIAKASEPTPVTDTTHRSDTLLVNNINVISGDNVVVHNVSELSTLVCNHTLQGNKPTIDHKVAADSMALVLDAAISGSDRSSAAAHSNTDEEVQEEETIQARPEEPLRTNANEAERDDSPLILDAQEPPPNVVTSASSDVIEV